MKTTILYERQPDGSVAETPLPTKWVICETCKGEGKSTAYLGAFSAEEMLEEDLEFIEDYVSGFYDRCCDECGGTGKVREADLASSLRRLP